MVYQLAKTSPLLTGQVKMNLILNGDTITDIQYTPISKHIKFNYANPVDVLNYSHIENIKMLYEKIADNFYKPITNPKLSTQHLYKFSGSIDDTHENAYEMGMKRCEYRRFKKQFEFFTPIWCDSKDDLTNLQFELCFEDPKTHKQIFKKILNMGPQIKAYITSCWASEKDKDDNLIYIDFKKYESYTQGINVEKGIFETKDTSYILKTLTEQERPVLETDNTICNLFSANKLIVPQIFNFNIVFGLEDILPITMLKSFVFEEGNAYINVYVNKTLVHVKDFYTNYESIPRYDIEKGVYNKESNVLDYAKDYKCVQLLDKNKLVQSTIHWALRDNTESIFNLYNGFAPKYSDYISSKITCNEPDIFASIYDPIKNPFGIFKYTNMENVGVVPNKFAKYLNNEDNFYSYVYDLENQNEKELEKFGNLFINTKKINVNTLRTLNSKALTVDNISTSSYKNIFSISLGIAKVNNNLDLSVIQSYICGEGKTNKETKSLLFQNGVEVNADISYTKKNISNGKETIAVFDAKTYELRTKNTEKPEILILEKYIYSDNKCKGRKIVVFTNDLLHDLCKRLLIYESLITPVIESLDQSDSENIYVEWVNNVFNYLKCFLIAIEKQQKIILDNSIKEKNTVAPSIYSDEIEFNKSEKKVELYRYCSNLLPLFIDTNIDNDTIVYNAQPWKNRVYWVKQYDSIDNFIGEKSSFGVRIKNEKALSYSRTGSTYKIEGIENKRVSDEKETSRNTNSASIGALSQQINLESLMNNLNNDPDCIGDYITEQNSDFLPLYPSIGYFPINELEQIDYKNFYLFDYYNKFNIDKYIYKKEVSWYKRNSLLYLPEEFTETTIIPTNKKIEWYDIKSILVNKLRLTRQADKRDYINDDNMLKYIFNKYICTFKTDYVSTTNINEQKVEIKFTLK